MPDSDDDDVPLAVKAAWAMAKARTCRERVGLSADDTVPSACGGALQQLHEEIRQFVVLRSFSTLASTLKRLAHVWFSLET